jgi:hypothetical protein
MGDEVFLDFLETKAKEDINGPNSNGAMVLMNNLRSRKLYKRVFKIQRPAMENWDRNNSRSTADSFCSKWRRIETANDMLNKIEDKFKLPRGSLVLWCPDGRSGMKLVRVNVTWEQGGGWHNPVELRSPEVEHQFQGVHDRVKTIERQYLDLWTLWVSMHPDQLSSAPAVIDALADEFGVECDPVFLDTYARNRLPGFDKAAKTYETLKGTLRDDFIPEVSRRVNAIAARDGTEVDATVVGEAIHSVSTERRAAGTRKSKRKAQDEPSLFDPDSVARRNDDEGSNP